MNKHYIKGYEDAVKNVVQLLELVVERSKNNLQVANAVVALLHRIQLELEMLKDEAQQREVVKVIDFEPVGTFVLVVDNTPASSPILYTSKEEF